jgi:D-alanyl-D-alanine carboxypeptidase
MGFPMIRSILLAALLAVQSNSVAARGKEAGENWDPAVLKDIDQIISRSGFKGEIALESSLTGGLTIIPVGARSESAPKSADALNWRWASITKQIIAVLILQEVAKSKIDLAAPVARYLPRFASPNATKMTVLQLLRHQSGLPNPDDTAQKSEDIAAYYKPGYAGSRDPLTGYCAGPVKSAPGGNWAYNNCDYIIAGALLEATTGKSWQQLVQQRIARPLRLKSLHAFPTKGWTRPGTIDTQQEPSIDFAAFGAAAGLFGSAHDLWVFDRALMNGELLPKAELDLLWEGQADLGYMAIGQWSFSFPLKGCAAPVRIVERRGAIGGVQVRNFILPDQKAILIAFAENSSFEFGEIWQGAGFSHDMLAASVCRKKDSG